MVISEDTNISNGKKSPHWCIVLVIYFPLAVYYLKGRWVFSDEAPNELIVPVIIIFLNSTKYI